MKLFRGFSFSLNRFLGITQAKQKFARETGVPTSKSGMQRKLGAMILSLFLPGGKNRKKKK